ARTAQRGGLNPQVLRVQIPPRAPIFCVWFTGNIRPVRLKPEQPWECKSPHADHFWVRHRTSAPGLPGEHLILARGWWGRTTRIRHGHVVKREYKIPSVESRRALRVQVASC